MEVLKGLTWSVLWPEVCFWYDSCLSQRAPRSTVGGKKWWKLTQCTLTAQKISLTHIRTILNVSVHIPQYHIVILTYLRQMKQYFVFFFFSTTIFFVILWNVLWHYDNTHLIISNTEERERKKKGLKKKEKRENIAIPQSHYTKE